MQEKILKDDGRGYKNLFLQILQLKNFLAYVGGGAGIFILFYVEPDKWQRTLWLFEKWSVSVLLWFIFILIVYRGELEKRLFDIFFSATGKIFPILLVLFSLYLALFPFELKKTLGTIGLIVLLIYLFRHNKKISGKIKSKEIISDLNNWTATETNNEQGTDFKEVNLKGKSIKTLEFRIKPSTLFWRAGFKLTDPNGSVLPLRTKNSLLFHVGSWETRDKFGTTGYRDGEWDKNLNKTINFGDSNYVTIKFQVNSKNFIECYINDKLEYKPKERIDPRILEKVFLIAWGDGNPYRVEFDKISYSF